VSLNTILISAAFWHIPVGYESPPQADGQTKVQRTLIPRLGDTSGLSRIVNMLKLFDELD